MIFFLTALLLICTGLIVSAQSEETEPPPGKVSAKIYALFNSGLDPENPSTEFEVRRAYFGYKRELSSHFSGEVKLDIGSVDDVSEYSLIRRYPILKMHT